MVRRAPRRVIRRRRRIVRRKKRAGSKGYSDKIYTVTFKPASQTLVSSVSPSPSSPPLYLNGASGSPSQTLKPLFPTPTLPDYSPNIALNSSTTSLPSCQDLGFGIDFQINAIENIGNYLTLFDQYRLNWIKMEVENLYPSSSIGYSTTGGSTVAKPFSDLYIAVDFDSVATPHAMQEVTGMSGVQMRRFTDVKTKHTFLLKPKTAMGIEVVTYPPAPTPGYAVSSFAVGKTAQWINSAESAVNYYGLKMWFTNWLNTQSAQQVSALRFTFTYNVSFKQPLKAC